MVHVFRQTHEDSVGLKLWQRLLRTYIIITVLLSPILPPPASSSRVMECHECGSQLVRCISTCGVHIRETWIAQACIACLGPRGQAVLVVVVGVAEQVQHFRVPQVLLCRDLVLNLLCVPWGCIRAGGASAPCAGWVFAGRSLS